MKRLLAAGLIAVVGLSGCGRDPAQAPPPKPKLVDAATVDAALKQLVDSGTLVGVSALVREKGEEVFFGAYGLADREADRPMRRDTIVRIYSMTKPITGVALMMLHDEGQFQFDDPLEQYAPEFANLRVFAGVDAKGQPIYEAPARLPTIRDVMRHTAGFPSGADGTPVVDELYNAADPMNTNNTLAEFAKRLGSVPLLYQPGTRWVYGPSVDVQAYLVERISGEPFDQFVQKRIFDPLGMNETRYVVPEADRKRLAKIYERSEQDGSFSEFGQDRLRFNVEKMALTPGGWGFTSTLDDYMRFARMLLNGGELDGARIISKDAIELMRTDMMPSDVTDKMWLPTKGQVGFGVDFAVRIAPPANAQEASGAVGEFFWDGFASTLFWVDPANELTAVFFTQHVPFSSAVHKVFRDAVYANDPLASALTKPSAATEPEQT
jgi:CubicO group peptidase (beta-lactamase class C family)